MDASKLDQESTARLLEKLRGAHRTALGDALGALGGQ